jgi:uncharacterized protein
VASPLAFLFRRDARADGGPLVPDPARVLDLPPGFRYTIVQRAFEPMSDGTRVPARPDGMACFSDPLGALTLMRNHELDRGLSDSGLDVAPPEAFDARAGGGVTRVVLDPKTLAVKSSNRVLAGTLRNCGGGASPWGFLSCEESVEAGHGYVFLCRTDAERLTAPHRLPGYGRFRHEAACVDPRTLTAYLSEDETDGCFYRYQPSDLTRPHDSGKLQALRVSGAPRFDTSRDLERGVRVAVDWVDVPEPEPKTTTVRRQATAAGAARFCRGEGVFYHDGVVYLCCTTGGREGAGQVFELRLGSDGKPDSLELFAESPGASVLDMPDNVYVAPWGDVLVAEDGSGEQLLRGITPEGRVYDIARNAKSGGELAGVCTSPSGDVIFVNLQMDGLTVAITGPMAELRGRGKRYAHRAT